MQRERIIEEYRRILKVFPGALLSNTFSLIFIPNVPLPNRYNQPSTRMLIRLFPENDYKTPEAYVNRELRIFGKKSRHLDESLTPRELREKGWLKECMQSKWLPGYSLVDFVIHAIRFLDGLQE